MSWIGVESADDERARSRPRPTSTSRQDWLLRVRLEGRNVDARLLRVTEGEAHAYARRLGTEYTLRPAAEL
ncbi:MAG TPA: hypothetical protein VN193_07400 [Candidatus Angelobacter sp.]|jgi:hypothetical protein|nr:hypothetical protein [Candidatus Angelobacter sp.]